MGLFANNPPNIPDAPDAYNRRSFDEILRTIRQYFAKQNNVQHVNVASVNADVNSFPTEADLADLRVGDFYVDTSASNVLKQKR